MEPRRPRYWTLVPFSARRGALQDPGHLGVARSLGARVRGVTSGRQRRDAARLPEEDGLDATIDSGPGGSDGPFQRRLGRQAKRTEPAPHGLRLGHRVPAAFT